MFSRWAFALESGAVRVWSRGRSVGHVERDGEGFRLCATRPGGDNVAWKFLMVCHCSMERNSLWTPLSLPSWSATVHHNRAARSWMEAALLRARRRKWCIPLSGRHAIARLVVFACETETQSFFNQPPQFRTNARVAWLFRWSTILASRSAGAFSLSAGSSFWRWERWSHSFHGRGCHGGQERRHHVNLELAAVFT